jgi:hypothetical protein
VRRYCSGRPGCLAPEMVPVLQAETQGRERECKDDRHWPVMLPPARQDEHNGREEYQGRAKDIPGPSRRAVPATVVSLALIRHRNLMVTADLKISMSMDITARAVTLTRDDH